jgi:hypothetical protein
MRSQAAAVSERRRLRGEGGRPFQKLKNSSQLRQRPFQSAYCVHNKGGGGGGSQRLSYPPVDASNPARTALHDAVIGISDTGRLYTTATALASDINIYIYVYKLTLIITLMQYNIL